MTQEAEPLTDFLATHSVVYSQILRNASTVSGSLVAYEALEVQLATMLTEGATEIYANDLNIKSSATRLLFGWNPSGMHGSWSSLMHPVMGLAPSLCTIHTSVSSKV